MIGHRRLTSGSSGFSRPGSDGNFTVIQNWKPGEYFTRSHEYQDPDHNPTVTVTANDDDGGEDEETCSQATTGRRVAGLSGGGVVWEGDTVTFTPSFSEPNPDGNETFEWQLQPLIEIRKVGEFKTESTYGPWETIAGETGATLTKTFSDPFIGRIGVKLTSGSRVSGASVEFRAKAAFPVNLRVGDQEPGVVNYLHLNYLYESSSGRIADLDGVEIGEFVWYTRLGWFYGQLGFPIDYSFPSPPFSQDSIVLDGHSGLLPGGIQPLSDGVRAIFTDKHGQVLKIIAPTPKVKVTANQYYWYTINDGFRYSVGGDPVGKVKWEDRVIHYTVDPDGTGACTYKIDKPGDGSIQVQIAVFPWP
jgi:hypothetical protein